MARERWTDERLDKSFDRIDADIRELRVEIKRGFERVDARFDAMQSEMNLRFEAIQSESNQRFDAMNQRFDAMQRTMIIGFVTLFASMMGTAILT